MRTPGSTTTLGRFFLPIKPLTMKHLYSLFLLLSCGVFNTLEGQNTPYLDEIFTDVNVEYNIVYATNISVLQGTPDTIPLVMDVYTPAGDMNTERPTVIYIPTGSFLPPYINGRVTWGKSDSPAVEICTRLAKRGYTAISASYRLVWNPVSADQAILTGTFLQAVYRGIQDIRSCIRFLRKTIAEEGNPYGIDNDRIVAWGQATGGYLAPLYSFWRWPCSSTSPTHINPSGIRHSISGAGC